MRNYKRYEKDAKTKPYSRQALDRACEITAATDKEKEDLENWLS